MQGENRTAPEFHITGIPKDEDRLEKSLNPVRMGLCSLGDLIWHV